MNPATFQPPLPPRRLQWALILLAALLVSNLFIHGPLPFTAGYRFPLNDFLTLLLVIFMICEANKAVYRYLDKKLPFDRHTIERLSWQAVGSFGVTIALFVPLHLLKARLTGEPVSPRTVLFYGCVALSISGAFNGVHIIAYFLRLVRPAMRPGAETDLVRATRAGEDTDLARATRTEAVKSRIPAAEQQTLAIQTGNRTVLLDPQQICWWYSSGGAVSLVKTDGGRFTTNYTSFAMIADRLPDNHFFHLTRQVIAHRRSIDSIQHGHNGRLIVLLKTPHPGSQTLKVVVSRYKKAAFQTWLDGRTS